MTRDEWDKLTPDQQYSVYALLEKKVELLDGIPRDTSRIPQSAEDAAKMVQDAWDKVNK